MEPTSKHGVCPKTTNNLGHKHKKMRLSWGGACVSQKTAKSGNT